jgi:hypothetical protein
VYVRDDRPFGGKGPPAALFYASRDRTREHPERHLRGWAGILQAEAFDGYNASIFQIANPARSSRRCVGAMRAASSSSWRTLPRTPGEEKQAAPISPIALEAVKRIDALFDVEREINGLSVEMPLAARQERSAALVAALEDWMRAKRVKLTRHAAVAKAIDYMITRWPAFTRFLADGHICLSNNAAERALRGLALGRKSWLFAGSERGAERAAVMYTLIQLQNSTTSIRRPRSLTSSPASPTRHRPASSSSSHGTGTPNSRGRRRHSPRPTPKGYRKERPIPFANVALSLRPGRLEGCASHTLEAGIYVIQM